VIFNPTPYLFTKDIAWKGFKSNPIFGIGLGNFGIIMKEAFCSGKIPDMYAGQDPHCTILGHSVQTGLVGLATLLLFWIMTLKNVNRRISHSSNFRKNTLVAMRAALIGMAISSINIDIMNFRFLWFVLGLATAVDNINEFSQPNEKTRICQQKFF
jgi:O-antigen ligase